MQDFWKKNAIFKFGPIPLKKIYTYQNYLKRDSTTEKTRMNNFRFTHFIVKK